LAKLVEERRATTAPAAESPAADITTPPPPPAAAREISALRLVWQALKSWLRSLFGNKGER
jgi:hypothetical protein